MPRLNPAAMVDLTIVRSATGDGLVRMEDERFRETVAAIRSGNVREAELANRRHGRVVRELRRRIDE